MFTHAPRVKANKETYTGLTNAFIEQYVRNHNDCNTLMIELDNGRPATNPQLKQWFVNTFPSVSGAEIRMEIAAEEATTALLDKIEKKVEMANKKKTKKKATEKIVPLSIVSTQ